MVFRKQEVSLMSEYKNVAVIGQGFVGLPLSLSFSFRGCNVYGVDIIKDLVNDINNGITHHTESFDGKSIQQILKEQLELGRYRATTDFIGAVQDCNNIVVTVGMTEVIECCEIIGRNLKKGDLVVIRSTVVPGTTEEKLLPILEERSGMKAGVDFYLAYSSERIAEGYAFEEFAYMPTVVGGINKESAERAKELLSVVCKTDVIIASDMKVVETAKVFENVQRDVNIAMVQEFARFTESLGIGIHEVIKVANTHKRVNLLTPGPGVGGYCIPNAFYYLKPKADELGVSLDLLQRARTQNENLPSVMAGIVEKELQKVDKSISGARIGVLGVAMKDYSNDDRISPPLEIIKILEDKGARVSAYDPAVPTKYDFKVDSLEKAMLNMDAVLILAKQKEFDEINAEFLECNLNKETVVFDTKNLFSRFSEMFERNGVVYKTI
jgi:UDP-N-acetyl-D-mannosaminuronic acid dehydrogenase